MRSPIISVDAKWVFQYVLTRQSPSKGKLFCWASMAEMEVHFRTYNPKIGEYRGSSSRGRLVDAIKELEHIIPEVFRVERPGGSGRNRYYATGYVQWKPDFLKRCQTAYDDLQERLKPTERLEFQDTAIVLGPLEPRSGPRTVSGPKTICHDPTVLWTNSMVKDKEVGECSGDASPGDSSRAVGSIGKRSGGVDSD